MSSQTALPGSSPSATRHTQAAGKLPWGLLASAAALGLLASFGRRDAPPRKATAGDAEQPSRDRAFGEPRSTDEPRHAQHARAEQRGRGRRARHPGQIPAQGWKDVLWRLYEEIQRDRLMAVAAGVAFYALLAIFPAVTALVSLYGLIFDPSTVLGHLAMIETVLPPGGFDIVRDQVERVVSAGGGGLTIGFAVGLAIALWSANNGVKAIFDALNVIYDEDEKRSFIKLNLISLTFTFGAIVLFLVFVGAIAVMPLVLGVIGLAGAWEWALPLLRWPAMFIAVLLALALIYRFGPSREKAQWRWVTVGSLFATVTWIAGSLLFSWYLQNFANYNAVYGSLGAVIGLMMWMWLSSVVVLIGGELNAEAEHQTARDTTTGRGKPLGHRGAAMADTVGEAKG